MRLSLTLQATVRILSKWRTIGKLRLRSALLRFVFLKNHSTNSVELTESQNQGD